MVWTREVALVGGGQAQSVATVLAAFFAGMAVGSRWLGGVADRLRSPLRFYAALEFTAAAAAIGALIALRTLGEAAVATWDTALRVATLSAVILPGSILLGGTLPALLKHVERDPTQAARSAGRLVCANTAGAVIGVLGATLGIPNVGLRTTLWGGSAIAIFASVLAAGLAQRARSAESASDAPGPTRESAGSAALPLTIASLAGFSTLALEVIFARLAGLQLGSSLWAWSAVLCLFLAGLAAGNGLAARWAAQSQTAWRSLGWIEAAAAAGAAFGTALLAPQLAGSAPGVAPLRLVSVAVALLAPAVWMGAAFPFFVRLGVKEPHALGRAFGRVQAFNTAGGVVGSLAAPFLLIPTFGLLGAAVACVTLNATLAIALHLADDDALPRRVGRALACGTAAALLAAAALRPPAIPATLRVLFVAHGPQASAVVVHTGSSRELIVDGDPEASTDPGPRMTEEMLAALPLLLHPGARSFLEIGLGSGITLGTAARFDLERIECVEIADSVVRAAGLFAPDNGDPTAGVDPRVKIIRGDGRAHLLTRRAQFDVAVANTLHPWSLGATGLYSREYFGRLANTLNPSGIAAQWLPIARISGPALAAILRTFFDVFEHGSVWWAADNLILLGSMGELPEFDPDSVRSRLDTADLAIERLGLRSAGELVGRRVADARATRKVLGSGWILRDDLPALESRLGRGATRDLDAGALAVVSELVEHFGGRDSRAGALRLWIEARQADAAGEAKRAEVLETLAANAGLELARRARVIRLVGAAGRATDDAQWQASAARALHALETSPLVNAEFALAAERLRRGDRIGASEGLRALLQRHPGHAESWNLLGALAFDGGDRSTARAAFESALRADPFFPQALGNLGLVANADGDRATAERMLARLGAISVLGRHPEAKALAAALASGG